MLKIGNIINLPFHYNDEIQSIDMIVADFNHYKRCDCKEDDTVLLATRYLYPEKLAVDFLYVSGPYSESMKTIDKKLDTIKNKFPNEIQDMMVEVLVPYDSGSGIGAKNNIECVSELFIPSVREIGGIIGPNTFIDDSKIIPIFDGYNKSRCNTRSNGEHDGWFTRSSFKGSSHDYWVVTEYGDIIQSNTEENSKCTLGLDFKFCVDKKKLEEYLHENDIENLEMNKKMDESKTVYTEREIIESFIHSI